MRRVFVLLWLGLAVAVIAAACTEDLPIPTVQPTPLPPTNTTTSTPEPPTPTPSPMPSPTPLTYVVSAETATDSVEIEILILQALASQAGGDNPQAMVKLEKALTLAMPGGFTRIFVDEGPVMAALLREAAKHDIVPNYVSKLRAAFGKAEGQRSAGPCRHA